MKSFLFRLLVAVSVILASSAVSSAKNDARMFLARAVKPSSQDLAGDSHRLYFEAGGEGWAILYRSAEIAVMNQLGSFHGVWLPDERTGEVKVFRFDNAEGIRFSVFAVPGLRCERFVIGYRMVQGGDWNFMFPEGGCWENDGADPGPAAREAVP